MVASSQRGAAPPPRGIPNAYSPPAEDEFEEISLVDIVRVLHRRRAVLAITLALALVGGATLTYFTAPEYESSVQIIPLSHQSIMKSWLDSRQAASFTVATLGESLYPSLYPDAWETASSSWKDIPPTEAEIAAALQDHVTVTAGKDAPLKVTARMGEPTVARDVAQAYADSLTELRPQLENITRSALFDKYYDGTNSQEAQARAETAAREQSYWIVFDTATVPTAPVKPRPVLNMALAGVLGVMGGVMVVFGLEWLSRYKGEFTRIEPPPQ